jgi:hypothetical protein
MIAAERIKNPQLLDILRRWWEEKYQLPWNHEAAQELTIFELLIGFWEDHYNKNPMAAKRTASGEVFFSTGDPLIDKWEREISMGLDPDLLEGKSPEEREREERALQRLIARRQKVQHAESALGDGFSEDYSDALAELPVIGSNVSKDSNG